MHYWVSLIRGLREASELEPKAPNRAYFRSPFDKGFAKPTQHERLLSPSIPDSCSVSARFCTVGAEYPFERTQWCRSILVAEQTPEQVLEAIGAEVRRCTACRLCEKRTKAVPGEGALKSGLMFIGEGPGFNEDQQGRPFVGPAGKLLEELLAAVGLRREQVYITNVVKCRPPGNRDPQPDEIAACNGYLDRQLAAIEPRIVITLGRFSLARFFAGAKISAVHGEPKFADSRAYVPFYHPAAGLRSPAIKQMLFEDIQKLPAIAKRLKELQDQGHFDRQETEAAVADTAEDDPGADQLSLF